MRKVYCRAFLSLFLMATLAAPWAIKAGVGPLQVYNSTTVITPNSALVSFKNPWVDFQLSTSKKTMQVLVTGYSSSPDETDDDPFITAAGTVTREGVVAANFLPLGTKIKMPAYFGNTVFIVEDRMHERFKDRIGVWFSSKSKAIRFGKRFMEIEIE